MTRDDATATFTAERPRLLGIAHRVLTRVDAAADPTLAAARAEALEVALRHDT